MPGVIDSVVLWSSEREAWLDAWSKRSACVSPRLRLHHHELEHDERGQTRLDALRSVEWLLRRYDVALLPVAYSNLSWARTALAASQAAQGTPIPILALVHALHARAIQDLLELGVADFLRDDTSCDDLHVRVRHLRGNRCRTTRTAAPSTDDSATSPWQPNADVLESFRTAKLRVVANFEREYLTRILRRYAGNISMAARAAQKHRRAFWALLHKYQIDANLYRDASYRPPEIPPNPKPTRFSV